ncbi:hypothetical protein TKK_0014646 [Trichogramma kaykai]|uniref:Uncharacterized protein n=1 Tax=Trichogramma kaykai TaxID=54128 RepID=A0ABD2WD30_9HYME
MNFVYEYEPAFVIVKFLFDYGVDEIDREDDRGATLLQYAVASLQFELVEELLALGAKVDDVVFEGGYFDFACPHPSLKTIENLIGIVEILRGYGYEMSGESELKVIQFLMDVNMHEYDPEVDQTQLCFGVWKLMKKLHEMMAIQRHLEVLHVGRMHKSANIRMLLDVFKRACYCYRGYFAVENFHWRFSESDVEATLLRFQQSNTLTFEDTIEQKGNERIQNRIMYEDDDQSVRNNAVSEYNEHIYEDDW